MRVRVAVLALLTAVAGAVAVPARAAEPLTLVAGTTDGGLARITIGADGAVTSRKTLVKPAPSRILTPMKGLGGVASVMSYTYTGMWKNQRFDTWFVDTRTGRVTTRSTDGRTGQVFPSPDGKLRYVLTTDAEGLFTSLYRTDARGRARKTLIAAEERVYLSDAAVTPDGKTLYVARMPYGTKGELLAIDTATLVQRVVPYVSPYGWISVSDVSRDGKTVALTFFDEVTFEGRSGLLDPVTGVVRFFVGTGSLAGPRFTPAGDQVLLSARDMQSIPSKATLAIADATTLLVTPVQNSAGLEFPVPVS